MSRITSEEIEYIEASAGIKLSAAEKLEISAWPEDLGVTASQIQDAFLRCATKGKTSTAYVRAVLCSDSSETKGASSDTSVYQARIFRALGFYRHPTEEESRIIARWENELGVSIEDALDACKATVNISSPSIGYVNRVIENRLTDIKSSVASKDRSENLQKAMQEEQQRENALANIYKEVPEIEALDEKIQELYVKRLRSIFSESPEDTDDEIKKLLKRRSVLLKLGGFEGDF